MQKVRQEERTMALIYAVEDDKNILEIEMFALKNSGYQVEGFECARDFYKKLEEKQPDLALLDIMLPSSGDEKASNHHGDGKEYRDRQGKGT